MVFRNIARSIRTVGSNLRGSLGALRDTLATRSTVMRRGLGFQGNSILRNIRKIRPRQLMRFESFSLRFIKVSVHVTKKHQAFPILWCYYGSERMYSKNLQVFGSRQKATRPVSHAYSQSQIMYFHVVIATVQSA
jgi:hypothetical protein